MAFPVPDVPRSTPITGARIVWLGLVWGMLILLSAISCGLSPLISSGNHPPDSATATVRLVDGRPTTTGTVFIPPSPIPTATEFAALAPETSEVLVYLVALEDNGSNGKLVGCGDSLVPVRRQISLTRNPIVSALNELFAIKEQHIGESGLFNALYQSDLRVESVGVDENGIATVVLTGKAVLGGSCDTPRFIGQIEETVRAVAGVQSANILLNGITIRDALSTR